MAVQDGLYGTDSRESTDISSHLLITAPYYLQLVALGYSFILRRRRELVTTKTELKAIAPAATIGLS